MELKTYQKQVMDDLSAYMGRLNRDRDIFSAWTGYWMDKDIAVGPGKVPFYQNAIPGVPHVCMKVPTGGGKTFMACARAQAHFLRPAHGQAPSSCVACAIGPHSRADHPDPV